MIYAEWAVLALASLFMKLFVQIAAPFIAPFANRDGWLPEWLSWFQTPDNSLDGDAGWRDEHWQWRYRLPGWLATYVGRVGWLMRNSAYGFEIDVLGVTVPHSFRMSAYGDNDVTDRPPHQGYVMRRMYDRDGDYVAFQFYAVYPWAGGRFCLRIMAGWKIWQHPKAGQHLQLAINLNPFKSYRE